MVGHYEYCYKTVRNRINMTYNIKFTDTSKTPIRVEEATETNTDIDVYLFGRVKTEYGEQINENLLHLLENFACPEDTLSPGVPDLALTYTDLLAEPIEGQFWYNMTQKRLFFWDSSQWVGLGTQGDIAANWGRISHGEALPQPISSTTGYVFGYDECIWSVSPATYSLPFDYMVCYTDSNAVVNMQYTYNNVNTIIDGIVNYLIIGIRNNNNLGTPLIPTPPPSRGATPTPTPTPTVTPTVTPSNGAVIDIPLSVSASKTKDIDDSLKTRFPELPGDWAIKWPLGVSVGTDISLSNIQPWVEQVTADNFYISVSDTYPTTAIDIDKFDHKYILISDDGQDGRVFQVKEVLSHTEISADLTIQNDEPGSKWLRIHAFQPVNNNSEMEPPPAGSIIEGITKVHRILNPHDPLNTIASTFNENVLTENRYALDIVGGTGPYRIVSFEYLDELADLSAPYALERHQVVGVTGTNFTGTEVPIAIDHAITNFNTVTDTTELRPSTVQSMVNLPGQYLSYSVPITNGVRIPDYLITNVVLDMTNFYYNKNNLDFTATKIIGSTDSTVGPVDPIFAGNTIDYTSNESLIPMGFRVVVEDSMGVTASTLIGARYHAQTLDYQRSPYIS